MRVINSAESCEPAFKCLGLEGKRLERSHDDETSLQDFPTPYSHANEQRNIWIPHAMIKKIV